MKTLIFFKKLPASGIPGTYALSIKIICTPWKSRETIPLRVHFLLILFINSEDPNTPLLSPMLVANPAKAKESTGELNGHTTSINNINNNNNSMKTTELSSSSYSNGIARNSSSQAKLSSSEIQKTSSSLFQQTNKEIRSSKLGTVHMYITRQSLLRKIVVLYEQCTFIIIY